MQIEISGKAKAAVEKLVANGDFDSADEAIEAAVDLLSRQQAAYARYLDEKLEAGRRDAREGRHMPLTEESAEELKRQIREQGLARLASKPSG